MLQALCPSAGFLFRPTLHLSHLHVYLSWLLTANTSFRNTLLFTLRSGEGDQRYFLQKSSLDALNTPSHTPCSTSVYDALHGFYFAGWRLVLNLNGTRCNSMALHDRVHAGFVLYGENVPKTEARQTWIQDEWMMSQFAILCLYFLTGIFHSSSELYSLPDFQLGMESLG